MPIRRFFSRKTQNSSTSDVSTRPPSYRQNMPLPSYSSVQDVDGLNRPEHNTHLRTQSGDVPSVASMSVIESPTSASIAESSFATDAKSMVGSIASDNSAKPTHRWIYYRVYTEDGGIVSRHPIDPLESSLARIQSSSVPPPPNPLSIKRRLCTVESILDPNRASLFLSPSSQSPMDENGRVSIVASTGPGFMPEEPLALVVKSRAEDSFIDAASFIPGSSDVVRSSSVISRKWTRRNSTANITSKKPRYLYYRIYTENTEVPSRRPFRPSDPSLSRINSNFISPPHTASSIRRAICRAERITDYANSKLFATIVSDAEMEGEEPVSVLSAAAGIGDVGGLNATVDDPMALVCPQPPPVVDAPPPPPPPPRTASATQTTRDAQPRPRTITPPPPTVPSRRNSAPMPIDRRFNRRFRASVNHPGGGIWLAIRKGDIVYTDGMQMDEFGYSHYNGQNQAGRRGRLYASTGTILKDDS